MSGLVLLIAFFAIMFFMHRGPGALGGMGCCGGGHMHGSHDHESSCAHEQNHKPDLTSVREAEYVDVTDEPVKEVNTHRDKDYTSIQTLNSGLHKR